MLSLDQEYLKERKQQEQQAGPKHAIDGLGQGLKGFGTGKILWKKVLPFSSIDFLSGLFNGITGVVTDPYKQAKKDGVKGFFKGVATVTYHRLFIFF